MTNLNTAFDVAEKYLDIPKMLDAEGELRWRKSGGLGPSFNLSVLYSETEAAAERQKILQQPNVDLQHKEKLLSYLCQLLLPLVCINLFNELHPPPPLPHRHCGHCPSG